LALYDILSKATPAAILAILLMFLLKSYIDSNNKDRQNHEIERKEYQILVADVRKEGKEREIKLISQLDKYNKSLQQNTESLKEISKNMQAIPVMQADISYLKEKVK